MSTMVVTSNGMVALEWMNIMMREKNAEVLTSSLAPSFLQSRTKVSVTTVYLEPAPYLAR